MPDYAELQATIDRIRRMERYLDEVMNALNTRPNAINEDAAIREKIRELTLYYQNGQWLRDYDCDARGELPADLKRGVLSQDALYDLLCEIGEQKMNTTDTRKKKEREM